MDKKTALAIRKTVTLPNELWERLDDFRFARRYRTEGEAIRRLLERGLEAEGFQLRPADEEDGAAP